MIKARLTGAGMAPLLALGTAGTVTGTLTATGSSSQANSLAITDDINWLTTCAANAGVRLPSTMSAGDRIFVFNGGASTCKPYPPVGGTLNGAAVDATLVSGIPTLKGALFICLNNLDFFAIVGA